ncbi:MAG: helix-turn-helix transcriptional regulator [Veillonellaceae bacterium]|nr:helix-turn-helix transcriptional regulator [Veillonellaceae bacterium]
MVEFHTIIKKLRTERQLTQKVVASKINVTPQYFSAVENGKKQPSLGLIKDFCNAINVAPEIFFWETVEVTDGLSGEDKKIINLSKTLIRHYFEGPNKCLKKEPKALSK